MGPSEVEEDVALLQRHENPTRNLGSLRMASEGENPECQKQKIASWGGRNRGKCCPAPVKISPTNVIRGHRNFWGLRATVQTIAVIGEGARKRRLGKNDGRRRANDVARTNCSRCDVPITRLPDCI